MSQTAVIDAPTTETTESPKGPTLDTTNRCDQCGAQAWVHVFLRKSRKLRKGGELMFCGHHYHLIESNIKPHVARIIDERHRLVENRLTGSEN